MTLEIGQLESLDQEECYRLLARTALGRVGVTLGAVPAVLPVNFSLLGEDVIFRTGIDGVLMGAVDGKVVAFEADHIDVQSHEGWSVMMVGWAHRVHDRDLLETVTHLPLQPWAPGDRDAVVQVIPRFVSGRRITHRFPAGIDAMETVERFRP